MGYEAYLREQLEISVLTSRYPYDSDMIEGILELMLDILCSRRKMMVPEMTNTNVVKGRFMKLNMGHIEYVMDCVGRIPRKSAVLSSICWSHCIT